MASSPENKFSRVQSLAALTHRPQLLTLDDKMNQLLREETPTDIKRRLNSQKALDGKLNHCSIKELMNDQVNKEVRLT